MTDHLINALMTRSRVTLTVFVLGLLAGLIAYFAIPKESNPAIQAPVTWVSVPVPGISPEDAERLIVRPLEEQMRDLNGLDRIESAAYEGGARVVTWFDPSTDIDQAILDVRAKVDLAEREFPTESEEPFVGEYNAGEEDVIGVVIYGPVDERTLLRTVQHLEESIKGVPGVLEVDLGGVREELLEVVVDPAKLESYQIRTNELFQAISANNRLVAAGSIDTGSGRFAVKIPGLFEEASDVYDIPVRASGDGVVTLGDLGEVRRTFIDATNFARFEGAPAMTMWISKRIGSNILQVNKGVKEVVEAEAELWPEAIQFSYAFDAAEVIRANINNLTSSIITAVILVMIILIAALGVRPAILVGVGIPSSFLLAFAVLNTIGFTLNIMVLFALVIAVGLIVDGAIVVVEFADRKRAEGLDRKEAFSMAAKRMFWPIASSTGTTIAAFLPFLFWDSDIGQWMGYLPKTLIIVLSTSLVVALIFLPVIGAQIGSKTRKTDATRMALSGDEDVDPKSLTGMTGAYARFAAMAIRRPVAVFFGVIGISVATFVGMAVKPPGSEFFVKEEPRELRVYVGAGVSNLAWEEKRDLVASVEAKLLGIEGVEDIYTRIRNPNNNEPRDMIGRIDLEFPEWEDRTIRASTVEDEVRRRLETVEGLRTEVRQPQGGPGQGKDIEIEVRGRTPAAAASATDRVVTYLRNLDSVIEVEDSRASPGLEWNLDVDRELAGRFGADMTTIGAAVQLVTNGILVGQYRPDDSIEEIDIRVRFPREDRGLGALKRVRVFTTEGAVPISNFVTRTPAPKVDEIRRRDGSRVIDVKANTAEGFNTSDAVTAIREWLDEQTFANAQIDFGGSQQDTAEAMGFFVTAMIVGLFLIAFILLVQFNNFYHVLLTLSAVIFSVIGVMLGFVLTGNYISVIMTGTGIVALAGIVVNNNIVLIDAFQRFRERGMGVEAAALKTAVQRMRPVLLTTLTTMIGLSPLMFGLSVDYLDGQIRNGGPSVGWWGPFASAIIYGLGFSTVITLLLTPAMLAAQPRQGRFFSRIAALWSRNARQRLRQTPPWATPAE